MNASEETARTNRVEAWILAAEGSSLQRYHILVESLYATLRSTASSRTDLMLRAMRALPPLSIVPEFAIDYPSTHREVIAANARFESGEWNIDEAFAAIGGDIDTIPSEVQP